jgi:hypothetical protein
VKFTRSIYILYFASCKLEVGSGSNINGWFIIHSLPMSQCFWFSFLWQCLHSMFACQALCVLIYSKNAIFLGPITSPNRIYKILHIDIVINFMHQIILNESEIHYSELVLFYNIIYIPNMSN